jgi:magnesium chelatase family protein
VLGELGLDGSIAAVAGVLPAAIGANARGEGLICPAACGPEAAWASPEMEIIVDYGSHRVTKTHMSLIRTN